MSGLVVDASAALKPLLDEPGGPEVMRHLRERIRSDEPIVVPGLFWLEVVNVLAVRHRYSPADIVEAVYELEQVSITTTEVGRPGVLAVIDAIARFGLTAYDAAYLVLAESVDAPLLTADARLAWAAGARAILVGSDGGVAEALASYATDPPWTDWSGAVAYLGELRSAL